MTGDSRTYVPTHEERVHQAIQRAYADGAAAERASLRVQVINTVDPLLRGVDVKQAVLDLLAPDGRGRYLPSEDGTDG